MSKRYLSWDIGICNLAYCIIDFNEDESFNIIKWENLNLFDDKKKCCFTLRTGKECPSNASYLFKIKELELDTEYYCTRHIKNSNYKLIIPLEDVKCVKCKKNAEKIIEGSNVGWCENHCKTEISKYQKRCVKKFKQNSTKERLTKLGLNIARYIDARPEMLDTDYIIIENQPVLKNPTMKSVAIMVYYHFLLKKLYEKKENFDEENLSFVSAIGKLKFTNSENEIKKGQNKIKKGQNKKKEKEEYNIRKDLSIKYTNELIEEKDKKILDTYKKKDDLCDCFLQAVNYHYKTKLPVWMTNKFKELVNLKCDKKNPSDALYISQ